MKRALLILCYACLLSMGCACPHRQAQTSHTIWSYAVVTNQGGWIEPVVVRRETWADNERGGGEFFFADPAAGQLLAFHTNQTALGGGSVFSAGSVTIAVDSNTAAILGAVGTAAGNIIGAAAKTTVR